MAVAARLNGKWFGAPKHRAKMVDATEKVQTVILDGAKIFFGRHGNLRQTMEKRGRLPGINRRYYAVMFFVVGHPLAYA